MKRKQYEQKLTTRFLNDCQQKRNTREKGQVGVKVHVVGRNFGTKQLKNNREYRGKKRKREN